MMLKRVLCGLGLMALALAGFGNKAEAAVFYPQTFTLANGLTIVFVQNKLSPAVIQAVFYRVGSVDEAAGHSGLAHYLEHLMFRGTPQIPDGAFSAMIAAEGGRDNAMTTQDFTAYHETVAADRLGMVMQAEADRMQNLLLTPETATPELAVVLNERDERTDNDPQGQLREKVIGALFGDHPYGRPVIGHRAEIAAATAEQAQAFYDRFYAPQNAFVVISGPMDLAEVMRLAAGTFGRVPARPTDTPHVVAPLPREPVTKVVTVSDARVKQPVYQRIWAVPSYKNQKKNEAYALDVLQEVLDGGEVGLLYRKLVLQDKAASSFGLVFDGNARGPATLTLAATPQAGQALEPLAQHLHQRLDQLARTGIPAAEVHAAKKRLQRAALFARDSLSAPVFVVGEALATGQRVQDIETWPRSIARVTPAQVTAALRHLVASPYCVEAFLQPAPEAEGAAPSQQRAVPMQDLLKGERQR